MLSWIKWDVSYDRLTKLNQNSRIKLIIKFEADNIDFRIKSGYCLDGLDNNFPSIKCYLAEYTTGSYPEKFLEYLFLGEGGLKRWLCMALIPTLGK